MLGSCACCPRNRSLPCRRTAAAYRASRAPSGSSPQPKRCRWFCGSVPANSRRSPQDDGRDSRTRRRPASVRSHRARRRRRTTARRRGQAVVASRRDFSASPRAGRRRARGPDRRRRAGAPGSREYGPRRVDARAATRSRAGRRHRRRVEPGAAGAGRRGAADLPFHDRATVDRLRKAAIGHDGALLTDNSGREQVLVGAWSTAGLRAAAERLGDLSDRSARHLLHGLGRARLRAGSGSGTAPWIDCDTPGDLLRARANALKAKP